MNLPNKITLSRIVAIVLMLIAVFVMFVVNQDKGFVVASLKIGSVEINPVFLALLAFFIVASATDAVDGHIARSRNLVTNLGKFMDPVADKLLVNSMLVFLCVPALSAYAQGQIAWVSAWCAILMIARDIVVEALRFIAAQKRVVIAANIFGKLKTVTQMVAIGVVLANDFPFAFFDGGASNQFFKVSDVLVYLATIISVLSGVIYVIQNKHVFNETKSQKLDAINLIKDKGLTLGCAESFTGGLFAREITRVPGASKFFKGGVVSYATEEKINVLGVSESTAQLKGVVSKECAQEMALGAKKVLNVDIAVSFTGNAGPDTMENKPCGETYIGIVIKDNTYVYPMQLSGNREQIQSQAIEEAFGRLVELISKNF